MKKLYHKTHKENHKTYNGKNLCILCSRKLSGPRCIFNLKERNKPLHSLLPKTIGTAVHFNRKEPQTKKPLRSLRYLDRLTSAMLSTSQYIALR